MTRVYIDTEFIETKDKLQLVSLGAVTDAGADYYAIADWFNPRDADDWVRENVLRKLPQRTSPEGKRLFKSRFDLCNSFLGWVTQVCRTPPPGQEGPPEFWGYFCDYDYVVLSQMYGGMGRWPGGWPQYFNDLRQWMSHLSVERSMLPPDPPNQHNALADCLWVRQAFGYMRQFERENTRMLTYAILKDARLRMDRGEAADGKEGIDQALAEQFRMTEET